jgi:hypothetical protein
MMKGSRGEYFIYNIIFSGNDTSRFFLVLKVEIISTPVAVGVVVGLCRSRSSSCGKRFYSAEVVVGGVSRELS